jgi:hypothetical protein
MTTSLPHTHVRLRDLSELVAGIPYVLGFPPTDSLVLFTFRRCPILTLSTTIRVDLPKREHVQLVVTELSAAAARNEAVAAIAVVVGEGAAEHRELVQDLRKALADNDILLTHASWVRKVVHGEQWQCYDDPLCTGAVPDPQTSALAAAIAVAGDTTYPDREAVAAHLAPDPEEALTRRKKLLDAHRTGPPQPYGEQEMEADLRTLGHALDMALSSYEPPPLNDHQLVRMAMAMSQALIRDECLAITLTDEPEPTERLWTVLVRSLPAPERAEPAVLLAVSAYLRGAGVLAALALEIALDSNPQHRTAILLDYALQMGMPPARLKAMLRTCTANNEEEQNTPSTPDDDPPWETTPEHQIQPTTDDSMPSSDTPAPSAEDDPRPPVPTKDEQLTTTPDISAEFTMVGGSAPPARPAVPAPDDDSLDGLWSVARRSAGGASVDDVGLALEMEMELAVAAADGFPTPDPAEAGAPQIAPGALSQRAATALGIPVRHTTGLNAVTAFLPPPSTEPPATESGSTEPRLSDRPLTDRSEPG